MASYSPGFVSLLTSQTGEFSTPGFVNLSGSESIDLESPDLPTFSSHSSEASTVKERKKWSPKEDVILISAQIQNYYNSSVQHVGLDTRELGQCKQRDQSSGENDNDVMKKALDMFFNDRGCNFTLEHAWRELRHDQKWCSAYKAKDSSKVKRKTVGGDVQGDEEVTGARPLGIKAAKAAKKKKGVQEESNHTELRTVLEMKDKLNKQKLLEKLLEKLDPLSEMEMSLKLKFMSEMLG
ncbi:PREDICTED: glutathione S-transferase T2-like [Brassica oleracea var. oleracea]|uniref:glutathione S-transferase T2-like n=1 Tax=Brassica oleracea var. oleracea TaxID=109376 RepID=UPI0006A6D248|nr:PREDICTED: glutathione S-transferase T2-like [Brassica oleracea var. oleracea]